MVLICWRRSMRYWMRWKWKQSLQRGMVLEFGGKKSWILVCSLQQKGWFSTTWVVVEWVLFDSLGGKQIMKIIRCMKIPGPSNGWCLNPKGLLNGTLSHPFGAPWRVLVIWIWEKNTSKTNIHWSHTTKDQTASIWGPNPKTSPTSPGPKRRCFSRICVGFETNRTSLPGLLHFGDEISWCLICLLLAINNCRSFIGPSGLTMCRCRVITGWSSFPIVESAG